MDRIEMLAWIFFGTFTSVFCLCALALAGWYFWHRVIKKHTKYDILMSIGRTGRYPWPM